MAATAATTRNLLRSTRRANGVTDRVATMRANLQSALASGTCVEMPCAHDGLSARLIAEAGFPSLFVSGYGCAASRGIPDTGYISFAESLQLSSSIIDAVRYTLPGFPSPSSRTISVCVDCDTGYGNEMNVRRTVAAFANAGASALMIEDQTSPKRCGHAIRKSVVPFSDAVSRLRAACRARDEVAPDMLIIGRTDANAEYGLDEALKRARAFRELGVDVVFVEAPNSLEELKAIGSFDNGFKMANMLLGGKTPYVDPITLSKMGFHLSAYPFDLLVPSISAMREALRELRNGQRRTPTKEEIAHLWSISGFTEYLDREAGEKGE